MIARTRLLAFKKNQHPGTVTNLAIWNPWWYITDVSKCHGVGVYHILCSITYSPFGGRFCTPAAPQRVARSARICDTRLSSMHMVRYDEMLIFSQYNVFCGHCGVNFSVWLFQPPAWILRQVMSLTGQLRYLLLRPQTQACFIIIYVSIQLVLKIPCWVVEDRFL